MKARCGLERCKTGGWNAIGGGENTLKNVQVVQPNVELISTLAPALFSDTFKKVRGLPEPYDAEAMTVKQSRNKQPSSSFKTTKQLR
jgi:hypothetical protein